jgi:uncharacterized membrane protein
MIKKNLKILIITSVVILLPILAGVILWNQLPDQLPIHWNAVGDVDGWAPKAVGVFAMPVLLLAIHWLCVVFTVMDPKSKNHQSKILQLMFWILPVTSVLIYSITFATAIGHAVRVEVIMPLVMGLLFVIIGNYMPKCKQSYTIGIKIPWTLNSEENWNRTHRFAGWLWFVGGLGMMATGFIGGFVAFFAIALLMVIVPMIYSYILYRKGI